ncbi:MAG: hypothetical protein CR988_06725 [Treponema sp.]|nr:MAG: hypothetical protein CR988_06725 [Treponema sp.]
MKKPFYHKLFLSLAILLLCSCSIQQLAYNKIAPPPEKKFALHEKELQQIAEGKEQGGNPILALTGEDDVQLVSEVFPVILKTFEMLYFNDPTHSGVALMTGQLYVMYANAFVEKPAKRISDDFYDKKNAEFFRAKKFYLRGGKYCMQALEAAYPGFSKTVFSFNEEEQRAVLQLCQKHDVEALFWSATGILGAFALDPLDPDVVDRVYGSVLMLEKAAELIPDYNDGGLWEVLTAYYAAAPEGIGGGIKKAKSAYKKAKMYSKGKKASTFVTFATAFCIPNQDGVGFDKALNQALDIDPDDDPENRLMTILAQSDARWLKEHKEDFIFEY